jgi:hypothetical protein
VTAEFSHPLVLANVPAQGLTLRLEATAEARAQLSARLGLLALHAFSAELHLRPEAEGRIGVRGRLRAELDQACVVTLEPVREHIDAPVAWRLLPPGLEPSDGDDDPDDIESEAGVADLGEALAQDLALALDPYPRAPGAEVPAEYRPDETHGPFAALSRLRDKN